MKEYKNRKKEWVSATIMTSAVFAGLFAGGASHSEPSVFAQTDESSMSSGSSEKTSSKLTIKESSESEKKALSSESIETKSTTKKSESKIKAKPSEKAKRSTRSVTRAAGYVGPKDEILPNVRWDLTKDYAAQSATTFVSQSGKADRPNDPVMYFGNKVEPFQPSELSNNNTADLETGSSVYNKPSWSYTYTDGINPRVSIIHGMIMDGKIERSYGTAEYDVSKGISGIQGGILDKSIIDYHLYKNKTNTGFKATMYDTKYNVSYTFESVYGATGGVYRYFSITNNDSVEHEIGALETNDTLVDVSQVPLQSLGPDEGFKMDGAAAVYFGIHTLDVRLNDPITGSKLGGWTNYTGGDRNKLLRPANFNNYFKGGLSGSGMEGSAKGDNLLISDINNPVGLDANNIDTAYIMKADPVKLMPGATLVNGSYLTYKQGSPSSAPVATVDTRTINAYSDQKNVEITGSVSDADVGDTKGHVEIGYPNGEISDETENTYDTDVSINYKATIDMSKLSPGENKLLVMAVDQGNNVQEKPETITVNVFKLGATAIPQIIKVNDTVKTDEMDLIKDLTIINQPTVNAHTLTIDPTKPSPSGKPLDNTKVGFYIQDMLLTDTAVKPNEIAKMPIPVTVIDDDTATDKVSALYAKSFGLKQADIQKLTTDELTALILKTSEAKGWLLATGAESKVSVDSTTLKQASTDGIYQAVIKNSDGLKKTINIEVTGGLKITSAPTATNFGSFLGVMLPYSKEKLKVQRSDSNPHTNSVEVSNAGKQAWTLTARLTTPLTEHNDANVKLNGVLTYIDASGQSQDIESNSAKVGSGQSEVTQEVSWANDKGIIVQLNGNNPSLKAGDYTGELTWTLADTPHS